MSNEDIELIGLLAILVPVMVCCLILVGVKARQTRQASLAWIQEYLRRAGWTYAFDLPEPEAQMMWSPNYSNFDPPGLPVEAVHVKTAFGAAIYCGISMGESRRSDPPALKPPTMLFVTKDLRVPRTCLVVGQNLASEFIRPGDDAIGLHGERGDEGVFLRFLHRGGSQEHIQRAIEIAMRVLDRTPQCFSRGGVALLTPNGAVITGLKFPRALGERTELFNAVVPEIERLFEIIPDTWKGDATEGGRN